MNSIEEQIRMLRETDLRNSKSCSLIKKRKRIFLYTYMYIYIVYDIYNIHSVTDFV